MRSLFVLHILLVTIMIVGCSEERFRLLPNDVECDYNAQDVIIKTNMPVWDIDVTSGNGNVECILKKPRKYKSEWFLLSFDGKKNEINIHLEENLSGMDRKIHIWALCAYTTKYNVEMDDNAYVIQHPKRE